MMNRMNVAAKWGRCLTLTLADGTMIDVKVLGEKPAAAVNAAKLLNALQDLMRDAAPSTK